MQQIIKDAILLNSKLPPLPKRPPKNLFDILGVQHREIRNSNILAYFFNPDEDHHFGHLFFQSLQNCVIEKLQTLSECENSLFDIDQFGEIKSVRTEEQTKNASIKTKSIDIVIEGKDWVVGIENKLHHVLNNPLKTYWNHLSSKKKTCYGILLTLQPEKSILIPIKKGNYFVNITHQELVDRIQDDLKLIADIPYRDLIYLKEYFNTIETHYYHLKEKPEMEQLLTGIAHNYKEVEKIIQAKKESENYIAQQIINVFEELGYEKVKNWYRRRDHKFDLYFYVAPATDLLKLNKLWLCFEVRNQTNENIDKIAFTDHFKLLFGNQEGFQQSNLHKKKTHTHAFTYQEFNYFSSELTFSSKLEKSLSYLINGKDSPVKKVERYLTENQINAK